MDLELARYLISEVINTWYSKGELEQVDISLLEVVQEIIEDRN